MGWLLGRPDGGRSAEADGEAARTYLARALSADPQHGPSNAAMGLLLFHSGKTGRALPYLERAGAAGPLSTEALRALSVAYAQQGNPAAARLAQQARAAASFDAALRKARRIYLERPDSVTNTLALADLEARRGDLPDALDLVKSVLYREPNHAAALALFYRLNGL
jgi:predicted Zn-dependent protease